MTRRRQTGRGAPTRPRSARRPRTSLALVPVAALLAGGGCGFGRPVPVDLSGPARARAAGVAGTAVEGDGWEVSVRLDGPGRPPAMALDGRPVRGCQRVGDTAVCRFVGLRTGEHRLDVDGLASPLWARVGPWDWRDAIVYLVIPDRFADGDPTNDGGAEYDPGSPLGRHGGDFAGLRAGIPHLADLGVNVLWTTPAVQNVVAGVPHASAGEPTRVHRGFHGYWPERLDAVDPHLGTEAELRALVSDLERAGVRTLMDVVVNHLGYGAALAEDPAWVRTPCPPAGSPEAEDPVTACIFGLPDLRTEDPAVAVRVAGAAAAWVGPARGAHAVRLDAARHVGRPFLRAVGEAVRAARPGALVVAEVAGASPGAPEGDVWFDEGGVDALFDFGFGDHALDFAAGRGRVEALARHLEGRHRRPDRLWFHALATHDTPPGQTRAGSPERFLLAVALQMTVAGVPVIYSGDEVGRLAGDWPDNRPDLPAPAAWDARALDHHRRLVALRRQHPALSRGAHRTLLADGDLLVFLRWWKDELGSVADAAVVAIHRGAEPRAVDLPFPPELTAAAPLPGADVRGGRLRFEAPALDALVLVTRP